MQILIKIEKYFAFIAAIVGFMAAKNVVDSMVFLPFALLFGIYFFPLRLFVVSKDKKWFQFLSSLLFANILIFLGIFLINPELKIIGNTLGIFLL